MRDLKDAKNIYDHIVVPEELDDRLRETLKNAPESKKKPATMIRFVKLADTCAAAFAVCFTIGLNTSEVFAREASQLPVVGSIAKEAFFATGGTEEEWDERSIDVNVSYEVKHQSNNLVSGKELTLTDLLGEDAYE